MNPNDVFKLLEAGFNHDEIITLFTPQPAQQSAPQPAQQSAQQPAPQSTPQPEGGDELAAILGEIAALRAAVQAGNIERSNGTPAQKDVSAILAGLMNRGGAK